jgi:hypothetical protein
LTHDPSTIVKESVSEPLYIAVPTDRRLPLQSLIPHEQPVPLPGIAPTALAVGEGAVWVGELDRKTLTKTLTRFNLAP